MWILQEKTKSVVTFEQNYAAWLVKNGKTVFSKLKLKMSLSVLSEQALGVEFSFLRILDTFHCFKLLF